MSEPTRPSERDTMGGIKKPDLRCEEHSATTQQIIEILAWLTLLDGRVKTLEEELGRRDTDLYEGD